MNVSSFSKNAYNHDVGEKQVRDQKQQKVQDSNRNFKLSIENNDIVPQQNNINFNPENKPNKIKISDQNSLKTERTVVTSQPEKKTFIGKLIELGKTFRDLWQKDPWLAAAVSFSAASVIVTVVAISLGTAGIFPAAMIVAKVCWALYAATAVPFIKGLIDQIKKDPLSSQLPQNKV